MRKKKLYAVLSFARIGCFRGFASGFTKAQAGRIAFDESFNGHRLVLVIPDEDMRKVPSKMIESGYWQLSTDRTDLQQVIDGLNQF